MRVAEYVTAGVLALFSLYLMWEAASLPIGWDAEKGPGSGAFPFWLSLGMLICCAIIVIRTMRGSTPESQATEPFMDRVTLKIFATVTLSIGGMLAGIYVIGFYGAIPLFLIFYLRFVGRHPWGLTIILAAATPIVTFFFFEAGMKILLPKGVTEPLFYPLYAIFL